MAEVAEVGRLFGRLYPGAGAAGGGGASLGEVPLEPERELGPDPGGGGLLARSVPALTCSLNDCCICCLCAPNEAEPGVPGDGEPLPDGWKPGKPGSPEFPIVGGVLPNRPVPESPPTLPGVCGPLS